MRNASGGAGHGLARRSVVACALIAATLVPVLATPADASALVSDPTPSSVTAAPDYATEALFDPWDYGNVEDQRLDLKAAMANVSNPRFADGQLHLTTQQNPLFDPVIAWPGDLAWGRDGDRVPIDAGRYGRISFKMKSSARVAGGLLWFNCPTRGASCQGGMPFQIETGWRTYDLPLVANSAFGALGWTGKITSLRVIPGNAANVSISLDWMRVYAAGSPVEVTWSDDTPGNQVDVFYDLDSDTANNTADNPGWGLVERKQSAPTNTTSFNAPAYPPGSYRFYAVDGSEVSPLTEPLLIRAAPMPIIEEPDAAGGLDYATAALGDAWDMSQAGDVAGFQNVTDVAFANGVLSGTNGGPNRNDPQVVLPLGATGIDGTRFHRLSLTYSYDGPFGLEDAPGGGTMSRIIWQVAGGGPNDYQDLNDLVTYSGQNQITFDLTSLGATGLLDEDQRGARLGWGGRTITSLRFDPNEDPGARRWHLDDIRIAEDDTGNGFFDIKFRDPSWEDGTTADVYFDNDSQGLDGTLIAADTPVLQGSNTVRWNLAGVPAGSHFIYVVLKRGGAETAAYSGGPVTLRNVSRLAGGDRITTSIAIAESTFAPGAGKAAVLARHDNFPDALAGTPLAGAKEGPLMLTPTSGLDPRVRDSLKRLVPAGGTVYLLGGEGALSPQVDADVRAAGYSVLRLAGGDRFATAVRIAQEVDPVDIFITTGTNFPDALSAGPAAIKTRGAVLLTNGNQMPQTTADFISSRPRATRYAIGSQAADADPQATRLAGADRFATSRLVAERFFVNAATASIASGVNFPDALAGGAHAASAGGPLLLSLQGGLPGTIRDYLVAHKASLATATLYGGEAALAESVRAAVEAAIA